MSLLVLVLTGWAHAQEAPAAPTAPATPPTQAPWPYGYPYPWPYPTPPSAPAAPTAPQVGPVPATAASPVGDLPPECKPIRLGTAKEIEKLMTELHATGRTQLAFVGNAVVCGWR